MSCSFILHLCYLVIRAVHKGLRNSNSQNRPINYLLSVCGKCRLYNKDSLKKCSAFPKFSHCEKEMALHICVKNLCSTGPVAIFFFSFFFNAVRQFSFPFRVRYPQFGLKSRSVKHLVPFNYAACQWLRDSMGCLASLIWTRRSWQCTLGRLKQCPGDVDLVGSWRCYSSGNRAT